MCIVGEKKEGSQGDGGMGAGGGGLMGRVLIKVRCMRLYESENIDQESM